MLSAKARAGTLTPEEDAEAGKYELIGHLLSIMQSKARRSLRIHRDDRKKKAQAPLSTHGTRTASNSYGGGPDIVANIARSRRAVTESLSKSTTSSRKNIRVLRRLATYACAATRATATRGRTSRASIPNPEKSCRCLIPDAINGRVISDGMGRCWWVQRPPAGPPSAC